MYKVAIYLRKSRADLELEARGEGETLDKHKKALLKLAQHQGYNVIRIFEEIVSGESLFNRPEMNELLKCVEKGEFDAVLVMDVDRLGRGNMQEQGLILETFRESNTKIITPRKTYDLNDEFDEEYSEFEAFMARKELKIITRRLQGGRARSVDEGNYIGTRPPYGWSIKKEGKSRWLIPHPEQFKVMNMIFEWYTHEDPNKRLGSDKIANQLNELGFKSYTGIPWKSSSVLTIIKNKVNIGFIEWGKKKSVKTPTGRKVRQRDPKDVRSPIGKHNQFITDEMRERFTKAQEILKGKYHVPYQLENGITNPLAGIIRCAKCGSSMVYRPYADQPAHIMCYNRKRCDNRSSRFTFVEDAVISGLEEWLKHYKTEWNKHKRADNSGSEIELKQMAVTALHKESEELVKQRGRIHDYFERGTYDEETYLERSQSLAARMDETYKAIERAEQELENEMNRLNAQHNIIPTIQNTIKLYKRTTDPAKKNALLKSILVSVEYRKERHQRNDDFEIKLNPKID
ncbi:recombinase family protein [Paenibacillus dakarensis]|uniref:recombinase family protein n=1 Tax=Paenibacillus dakarensis TaxID=1527293 RepID=UPI0006D53F88|nr:recombinase family protein [Paenibacillus dakarensis]